MYIPCTHTFTTIMAQDLSSTPSEILNKIQSNITINDKGCHVWNLGLCKDHPNMVSTNKCGNSGNTDVRRWLWSNKHGAIHINIRLIQNETCDTKCCNAEHMRVKSDIEERARIYAQTEEKDGHRLWTGNISELGYGLTTLYTVKMEAHRASYILENPEEDTTGLHVRHKCKVKHCIELSHLEIGTALENAGDRERDGTLYTTVSEEVARKIKLSKRKVGEEGFQKAKDRAVLFDVNISTIRSIDEGRTYPHLPDINGETHIDKKNQKKEERRMRNKRKKEDIWTSDDWENARKLISSLDVVKTSERNKGTPEDAPGDCLEYKRGDRKLAYSTVGFKGLDHKTYILCHEANSMRKRGEKEVILFTCSNKYCINSLHLRFGTRKESAALCVTNGGGKKGMKLNPDKVRKIRASDKTSKEISEEYGINERYVREILSRDKWGHVE